MAGYAHSIGWADVLKIHGSVGLLFHFLLEQVLRVWPVAPQIPHLLMRFDGGGWQWSLSSSESDNGARVTVSQSAAGLGQVRSSVPGLQKARICWYR